jgi:hypothetical protein
METDAKIVEDDGGKSLVISITLSRDEINNLTLFLGMATAVATREDMNELRWEAVKLANKIHQGDPDWHPYAIPEAYR